MYVLNILNYLFQNSKNDIKKSKKKFIYFIILNLNNLLIIIRFIQ
jgi:hypothetical protein